MKTLKEYREIKLLLKQQPQRDILEKLTKCYFDLEERDGEIIDTVILPKTIYDQLTSGGKIKDLFLFGYTVCFHEQDHDSLVVFTDSTLTGITVNEDKSIIIPEHLKTHFIKA